jgi:hypothetical protein
MSTSSARSDLDFQGTNNNQLDARSFLTRNQHTPAILSPQNVYLAKRDCVSHVNSDI